MGRRRRPGREPAYLWWIVFGCLGLAALYLWSWRLLLITLALWCLYEFAIVPKDCQILPNGGKACANPVRGRPFGCGRSHQDIKTDALWRLGGLSANPFRKRPVADPNRHTGNLVWSPDIRGRLATADRAVLILAALGTLVVLAGMAFGLTA